MCDSLFQGCDVPNASIGFSLLTGQYSYPMHYNLNKCKRWQYKSKQTTIHGHVHANRLTDPWYYNTCVEVNNYAPIPFEEIKQTIQQ